jgi:hypothetical protein
MVYHFVIEILGITKPEVWRAVTVPDSYTFEQFHLVIQSAFGWTNSHLYQFCNVDGEDAFRILMPSEMEDAQGTIPTKSASLITLKNHFQDKINCMPQYKMKYIYDFGDSWEHEISLISTIDNKERRAHCLAGGGMCPFEDVGGAPGFAQMKKAFKKNPFHNEYSEWLGLQPDEYWDPSWFSKTYADHCVGLACAGKSWLEE